jgi:hypothetical protein
VPAAGQRHLAAAPVDPGDRRAGQQLDAVGVVPVRRVHEDGVALGLALQVALGQRRPLVGPDVLLGGEHDPAVETLPAQRFGGLGAGPAAAGDDDRV